MDRQADRTEPLLPLLHASRCPSAGNAIQAHEGSSAAGPYGDWIHDLDYSVGRVLKALDENKFTQDTLLIFTSDNGGVFMTQGDRAEAVAYRAGLHVNGD